MPDPALGARDTSGNRAVKQPVHGQATEHRQEAQAKACVKRPLVPRKEGKGEQVRDWGAGWGPRTELGWWSQRALLRRRLLNNNQKTAMELGNWASGEGQPRQAMQLVHRPWAGGTPGAPQCRGEAAVGRESTENAR